MRQRYFWPGLLGLGLVASAGGAHGAGGSKPVAAKPIAGKPIATKPVAAKPVAAKPVTAKPVATRPVAPGPAAAKSAGTAKAEKRSAADDKLLTAGQKSVASATAPTLAKGSKSVPRPHENAYLEIPDRAFAESTRAFRYANLSDQEALDELGRRGIAWITATPPMPGVRTPIRLTAPLHGVFIHSTLPPAERAASSYEILDARLALALDDFCALLARHDVVEIVHYTMYRPPGEIPADWQRQIRHPAGLAIDVGAFKKKDGSWLAVGPHWPSNIGAKTCGEGALEHWGREARELASIVCEATDERIFHFALTPDFDAAHADHVHLEIKPATRWFIVN
jgi:hypothetical protein